MSLLGRTAKTGKALTFECFWSDRFGFWKKSFDDYDKTEVRHYLQCPWSPPNRYGDTNDARAVDHRQFVVER
jgi:hypothetical protein